MNKLLETPEAKEMLGFCLWAFKVYMYGKIVTGVIVFMALGYLAIRYRKRIVIFIGKFFDH